MNVFFSEMQIGIGIKLNIWFRQIRWLFDTAAGLPNQPHLSAVQRKLKCESSVKIVPSRFFEICHSFHCQNGCGVCVLNKLLKVHLARMLTVCWAWIDAIIVNCTVGISQASTIESAHLKPAGYRMRVCAQLFDILKFEICLQTINRFGFRGLKNLLFTSL